MNIRLAVISGFVWRSVGISGQRFLSFLVLVVLARILSVQEFGTAAIATMIVLLLQPITRFGVYDFLIQKEHVDAKAKSAALFVSFAFGIGLFIGLFSLAPALGRIFSDQELVPAIQLLSVIFLLTPISTVQESLLTREFKFKTIAGCQIAAIIPSGVVAIGLAALGYGVFSIVIQQVVFFFLTSLFTWILLPWAPVIGQVQKELPSMLRLGVSYTTGHLLSSINANLFGLAVGFVSGTDAAGLFRIAWAGLVLCMNLTVHPISNVAQPVFAARRADLERLRTAYLQILRYFGALTFPAFAFVGAMGPELVAFAFGDRWRDAGNALMIMSLFVIAGAPNILVRSFLNAIGRPDQAMALAVTETALSVVLLVLLAPWGINGVASAVVLRGWVALPITLRMVRRYAGVRPRTVLQTMAASMFSAALLASVVYVLKGQLLPMVALPAGIGILGVVGMLTYIGTIWLLDRNLVDELTALGGEMSKKRREGGGQPPA